MKRLLIACCALALVAVAANADVPDPSKCSTTLDGPGRLLMIPDGYGDVAAASFTVTVKNAAGNAIANAVVEIIVAGQGAQTRICAGNLLPQNTNAQGIVNFNAGGGGCLKAAGACAIRANGVEIRTFNEVMSPDYTGTDDVGIPGRSSLTVAPTDLASFVAAYAGGVGPSSCHDYNNTGITDPADLGVFVAGYKGGTNFCSP